MGIYSASTFLFIAYVHRPNAPSHAARFSVTLALHQLALWLAFRCIPSFRLSIFESDFGLFDRILHISKGPSLNVTYIQFRNIC